MNRPLAGCMLYFIMGCIGGTIGSNFYGFLFCLSFFIWLLLSMKRQLTSIFVLLSTLFLLLGIFRGLSHPMTQEQKYIKAGQIVEVSGEIYDQNKNDYYQRLYVKKVFLLEEQREIKSKVVIEVPINEVFNTGDKIVCRVEGKKTPLQMNPSDLDIQMYYRQEGILMETELVQLVKIVKGEHPFVQIKKELEKRVTLLFGENSLIKNLLLGEKGNGQEELLDAYYQLGVGHLLSLSGFHIGIILAIGLWTLSYLGLGYTKRHLGVIPILWGYTFLTGAHLSTVRACIMASIWIVGRCLWEEEDGFTSLSIAAAITAYLNPYQVYSAGFMLSFGAVLAILLTNELISRMDKKKYFFLEKRVFRNAFLMFMLNLMILPILSYYFYEIPMMGVFLNLLMIPIFSLLIPYALIILAVSMIYLPIAIVLGRMLCALVEKMNQGVLFLAQVPGVNVCIGRMNLFQLSLYILFIGSGILILLNKKKLAQMCLLGALIGVIGSKGYVPSLEINHLYVGQGDASVIFTPDKKVVVIDGGPVGKGKVVKQFLNYKGYGKIDTVIISHDHEDHIGGIIDLLEAGFPVGQVIVGEVKEKDDLRMRLEFLCVENRIPVTSMVKGNYMVAGDVKIEVMWPNQIYSKSDNNASLICLLTYRNFTTLFTGDTTKGEEEKFILELDPVSYVKIAHHGSDTSTSKKFLEKMSPKWATISCGIGNRYGHPSEETLEKLKAYDVVVNSTHEKGWTCVKTNGEEVSIQTKFKEVVK